MAERSLQHATNPTFGSDRGAGLMLQSQAVNEDYHISLITMQPDFR